MPENACQSGNGQQKHMSVGSSSPPVPPLAVILDANALLIPFQFRVDLERELDRLLGAHEAIVPSSVVRELEGLAPGNRKARAALELAHHYRILPVEGRGDAAIREAAEATGGAVLTNDRALRRTLRAAGHPVLFLRGKSTLAAEGLPLR